MTPTLDTKDEKVPEQPYPSGAAAVCHWARNDPIYIARLMEPKLLGCCAEVMSVSRTLRVLAADINIDHVYLVRDNPIVESPDEQRH